MNKKMIAVLAAGALSATVMGDVTSENIVG